MLRTDVVSKLKTGDLSTQQNIFCNVNASSNLRRQNNVKTPFLTSVIEGDNKIVLNIDTNSNPLVPHVH